MLGAVAASLETRQQHRSRLMRAVGLLVLAQVGPLVRLAVSEAGRRDLAVIALPMLIAYVLLWRRRQDVWREGSAIRITHVLLVSLFGIGWAASVPDWLLGAGWSVTLAAATLVLFGRGLARAMIFPCLGLTLVGLADGASRSYSTVAQRTAASASGMVLGALGDDVRIRDTWLLWPGGRVEVTAECAGASSWLAGFVWCWFLICVAPPRRGRVVMLLGIAGLVLAGANILRIAILFHLVRWQGQSILDGAWHSGIGLITYAGAFSILIALWWRWQRPAGRHAAS